MNAVVHNEVGRQQHRKRHQSVRHSEEQEAQSVQHLRQLSPIVLNIVLHVHVSNQLFDPPYLCQKRIVITSILEIHILKPRIYWNILGF